MKNLNNIKNLVKAAEDIWLPRWLEAFGDETGGGFHERLDLNWQPTDRPKRLLSQCRQIIVYAHYIYKTGDQSPEYIEKLNEGFDYILEQYHNPETGGCVFSLNKDNSIHDHKYDLYAHAFVILACAKLYKAIDHQGALELSKTTLNFIHKHFKMPLGYTEAVDEDLKPLVLTRRQNPHMHLMEACVYMYESCADKAYLDMATTVLNLFFDKFLDPKTSTFSEFFEGDLTPHTDKGDLIEAGHHAEWIWLLKRYNQVSDLEAERIEKTIGNLFEWVKTHAIDPDFGGVYNVQNREGKPIDTGKRIWCQFETLRAAAIMTNFPQYQKEAWRIIEELSECIKTNYIDLETGAWRELLKQDLSKDSDFLPATTPYHIYPALTDVLNYLD